jgi:hypothetical protein
MNGGSSGKVKKASQGTRRDKIVLFNTCSRIVQHAFLESRSGNTRVFQSPLTRSPARDPARRIFVHVNLSVKTLTVEIVQDYSNSETHSGTFRAGKGALDLYLEGEKHLYNKNHIETGKFLPVHDPGISRALPAGRFNPALIFCSVLSRVIFF